MRETSRHFTTAVALLAALGLAGCGDAGDRDEAAGAAPATAAPDTAAAAEPGTASAAEGESEALVDPNTAGEDALRALPGMDSAAVATVVERRPFASMLALDSVLSERMDSTALDALYRRMFIPVDLNSASREEILLIPGVGPRMAREFLEYRPYDGGMAEFRQEIGKYVDEAEVARLERYVTIR